MGYVRIETSDPILAIYRSNEFFPLWGYILIHKFKNWTNYVDNNVTQEDCVWLIFLMTPGPLQATVFRDKVTVQKIQLVIH